MPLWLPGGCKRAPKISGRVSAGEPERDGVPADLADELLETPRGLLRTSCFHFPKHFEDFRRLDFRNWTIANLRKRISFQSPEDLRCVKRRSSRLPFLMPLARQRFKGTGSRAEGRTVQLLLVSRRIDVASQ